MSRPRLSVVVPVYNTGDLSRGLESTLNQTFEDFEIIIVNDGSTDHTLDVLRTFAESDRRIRILNLGRNYGIAGALNRGITESRSELIARMDIDDLNAPTRFETQIAALDEDRSLDVVGSWFVDRHDDIGVEVIRELPQTNDEIRRALSWGNVICHPSVVVRRSCFDRFGKYDGSFRRLQDYDLWLRWRPHVVFGNIPSPLLTHYGVSKGFARSKGTSRAELIRWHLRARMRSLRQPGHRLKDIAGIGAMLITQTYDGLFE